MQQVKSQLGRTDASLGFVSGSGGGSWSRLDVEGKLRDGHASHSGFEGKDHVKRSRHVFASQEILIEERFHVADDGRKLFYTHRAIGPDQHEIRHEVDFDLTEGRG
jgi:hypothetical protein